LRKNPSQLTSIGRKRLSPRRWRRARRCLSTKICASISRCGLEANPRSRRPGHAGHRYHRNTGHSPLAAIPGSLRPADSAEHERPPCRRASFAAWRTDRDIHRGKARSAHDVPAPSACRHCVSRQGRPPYLSRMFGLGRTRKGSNPTSTSSGESKARTGLRTERSACLTIQKAVRARFATRAARPTANGCSRVGRPAGSRRRSRVGWSNCSTQ
jgi:hypothetical protein